jgi:IclR family pca regulon transcriptional regulator
VSERNYIQSLERGLAVITTFSQERPRQSIAEVARRAEVSRAAARRILLTLEKLGFVGHDDRGDYSLRPAILSLGYTYLATLGLPDLARPVMEKLVAAVQHSCSIAVLDADDAVYVGRVPSRRFVSFNLTIGSRLPAHLTALGRVLLAGLDDVALRARLDRLDLTKRTQFTNDDRVALEREIVGVRKKGYAIIGQELEYGVWAVAAPIVDRRGVVRAAINLAIHDPKISASKIRERELLPLLEAAADISRSIADTISFGA